MWAGRFPSWILCPEHVECFTRSHLTVFVEQGGCFMYRWLISLLGRVADPRDGRRIQSFRKFDQSLHDCKNQMNLQYKLRCELYWCVALCISGNIRNAGYLMSVSLAHTWPCILMCVRGMLFGTTVDWLVCLGKVVSGSENEKYVTEEWYSRSGAWRKSAWSEQLHMLIIQDTRLSSCIWSARKNRVSAKRSTTK